MKKLSIIISVLLQLVTISALKAQIDPHFSQYYAYPLWLNPALTGTMDGYARVTANYRDQWPTINNSYKTQAISADYKATDKVGIGINILDQSAGSAGFNYLAAYASFGYGIPLSTFGDQKISFGLQAGIINRSFNQNDLQLDDQYDPLTGYNASLPTNENFLKTNTMVFDASFGVYYYDTTPDNAANAFGGFSLAHFTGTRDPFAADGIKDDLPIRLTIHGGVKLNIDQFSVTPHLLYVNQKANNITAFGAYTEYRPDEGGNAFLLGTMYRFKDALVADAGYRFDGMTIGLSYDINTSPLRAATASEGGLELSISYVFRHNNDPAQSSSPSF